MDQNSLSQIISQLIILPKETEWIEFKQSFAKPEDIGKYISALSNSAALLKQPRAYLLWGINNDSKEIVGTTFRAEDCKQGNQSLHMWLGVKLKPVPSFDFHDIQFQGKRIVLLEITPISYRPVKFDGTAYIRVDSHTSTLDLFPEKERQLWAMSTDKLFEQEIAKDTVLEEDVLRLLDYPVYYELTGKSLPDKPEILNQFAKEKFISKRADGKFTITNLGALALAKDLTSFDRLARKAVRVIQYEGKNRVKTIKEQSGKRGYASGFEGLITYINDLLPVNELIEKALRKEKRMYPSLAIRELVANAIIHQDFTITGTSPMVEIFVDRLEISNPGLPLIDTLRLMDASPHSRNEMLASLMKSFGICEERGSGIDKIVTYAEVFQLPAPSFVVGQNDMKATLYAHKTLNAMGKVDKIRACYQHACLRTVSNEEMTNSSLRERFGIAPKNYAIASRIIAESVAGTPF